MPAPSLAGQFLYQSFRNGPILLIGGKVAESITLAQPWTPMGTLDVKTTSAGGDVIGTLTFRPGIELKVSGKISSPSASMTASVDLKGEGHGAVYQIKGWLVSDNHFVGSVLCISGDLARQPNGTVGYFVLFPTKQAGAA
jgi:hypothetical protein